MTDIVSRTRRSSMMSGIKSKNTRPEIKVRKALYHAGYRYRLNRSIKKIKPDLVLTRQKVALFVHGCYWHRHLGCKLCYSPKSRVEFWCQKFSENEKRDRKVNLKLQLNGWRVAVFWECATRKNDLFNKELSRLINWLETKEPFF